MASTKEDGVELAPKATNVGSIIAGNAKHDDQALITDVAVVANEVAGTKRQLKMRKKSG
jgi:hypothetical protein